MFESDWVGTALSADWMRPFALTQYRSVVGGRLQDPLNPSTGSGFTPSSVEG